MMEAASTSETSVNFYQTTRHNNPENKSSPADVVGIALLKFLPTGRNKYPLQQYA
jgi:hypothetical protein